MKTALERHGFETVSAADGSECINGHKFYVDYTIKSRHLCPICSSSMKEYGSNLKMCLKCRVNLPGKTYLVVDTEGILEKNGWNHYPGDETG